MPPYADTDCVDQRRQQYQEIDNKQRSSKTLSLLEEGFLRTQPLQQIKHKVVSFSPDLTLIHEIPHHTEFSNEERENVWMTIPDLCRIREENVNAACAQLGRTNNEDRGLESYIPKIVEDRKSSIDFARTIVMKYQKSCVEGLSMPLLYASASMRSKDSAYSRGLFDQRIVTQEGGREYEGSNKSWFQQFACCSQVTESTK